MRRPRRWPGASVRRHRLHTCAAGSSPTWRAQPHETRSSERSLGALWTPTTNVLGRLRALGSRSAASAASSSPRPLEPWQSRVGHSLTPGAAAWRPGKYPQPGPEGQAQLESLQLVIDVARSPDATGFVARWATRRCRPRAWRVDDPRQGRLQHASLGRRPGAARAGNAACHTLDFLPWTPRLTLRR